MARCKRCGAWATRRQLGLCLGCSREAHRNAYTDPQSIPMGQWLRVVAAAYGQS